MGFLSFLKAPKAPTQALPSLRLPCQGLHPSRSTPGCGTQLEPWNPGRAWNRELLEPGTGTLAGALEKSGESPRGLGKEPSNRKIRFAPDQFFQQLIPGSFGCLLSNLQLQLPHRAPSLFPTPWLAARLACVHFPSQKASAHAPKHRPILSLARLASLLQPCRPSVALLAASHRPLPCPGLPAPRPLPVSSASSPCCRPVAALARRGG